MSRIVGWIAFHAAPPGSGPVAGMLAKLPGQATATDESPGGVLGWKGWPDGPAGGIGGQDGIRVVLDGRILNGAELRRELSVDGDDVSLVIALYRRHGFVDALRRIAGDFAIALVDVARATCWLGRDRFGVKPLYHCRPAHGFAFSSQPRALLGLPGVSAALDRGFVARFAGMHYRTFDNCPESSPYANVAQLPAGHCMKVSEGKASDPIRYWGLSEEPDWDEAEEVLAERYRERLLLAVSRRVKSVRKAAFTLSGGLDSSSVLCCAAAVEGRKQAAVSSIYEDAVYDERDEIRDVVAERVSEWTAVEIPNALDLIGIVSRMVRTHDEPVATATWLSHFLLTEKMAASGFTALFGGLGGDELNAGEYEYFPMFFADLRAQGLDDAMEHEILAWAEHHDHPIFRKNRSTADEMMARLADPVRPGVCLPDRTRMMRYANVVNREFFDLTTFRPIMETPFGSYLKNRTYQDMSRETLPCCLRAEDRQCTAVGLEHFDPFLDHELVEFMYRVPGRMKIRNGVTKQLLRRAMTGILPEATRTRIKKTGWNAPAHRWFSGQAVDMLKDMVSSRSFRDRGVYRPAPTLALIDDHVRIVESGEPVENHMMFLWQLLNLSLWMESVDGPNGE
ncbi:MAG: asparagine synthase-related protein [Pseudomonadota bacterium]